MTSDVLIAVTLIVLLAGFVIRGAWGHRGHSDTDRGHQNGWHGNDGPGGAD